MPRITHGDEMHRDGGGATGPFEDHPSAPGLWRFKTGEHTLIDTTDEAWMRLEAADADLGAGTDGVLTLFANIGDPGGADTAKHVLLGGHGLVVPILTADPGGTASENGQVYYNSTDDKFRVYENGAWADMVGSTGVSDILDLPTAETDDTLVLAPDGAGGVEFRAETGGGGANIYDIERRDAGDISITSTTAGAAVGTIGDIVVAASTGDLLMIGLSTRVTDTDAQSVRLDVATIVSAAPVNYLSSLSGTPSNLGVSGWFIPGSFNGIMSGNLPYVVQAGDISGGNVTLSLRAWLSGAGNRPLAASSASGALVFWVKNFGA